jgi:hypothetical protein
MVIIALLVLLEGHKIGHYNSIKVSVFVGAFSEFGGCVYRIPAPIFGQKWQKPSELHQRGVGVRYRGLGCVAMGMTCRRVYLGANCIMLHMILIYN